MGRRSGPGTASSPQCRVTKPHFGGGSSTPWLGCMGRDGRRRDPAAVLNWVAVDQRPPAQHRRIRRAGGGLGRPAAAGASAAELTASRSLKTPYQPMAAGAGERLASARIRAVLSGVGDANELGPVAARRVRPGPRGQVGEHRQGDRSPENSPASTAGSLTCGNATDHHYGTPSHSSSRSLSIVVLAGPATPDESVAAHEGHGPRRQQRAAEPTPVSP